MLKLTSDAGCVSVDDLQDDEIKLAPVVTSIASDVSHRRRRGRGFRSE